MARAELSDLPAALAAALAALPRVSLAHTPTPLEFCRRLSRALGDAEVWIKRDDCTGLAFGGNKARQLEFTLGEAVHQGADCVIQGAASQSNHCRQCAAACARLGLACYLVLVRDARAEPVQGNLLLDHVLGAQITWVEGPLRESLDDAKLALAERLRQEGRRPYAIVGDRGRALSALGYVNAFLELWAQLEVHSLRPDAVYVCSAGATGAGLRLAARLFGDPFRIVSIAPIRWEYDAREAMARAANLAAAELGIPMHLTRDDFHLDEGYVGPGYGQISPEARAAIELTARTEGILLDPVYTGKAMAGLIDHLRRGTAGARVVFIHTGGTPALFAYADALI